MDEKQSDGDKKSAVVVVMKMEVHCDGCAKEVEKLVSGFNGVEDVDVDSAANKLTVIGKVDPAKLRWQRLEDETHKRVELVSPQPKKDGGEKKLKVVLKIKLHCEGCMKKLRRIICKINGVHSVSMDASKGLVTVRGAMDVKELVTCLQEKLKRHVFVRPTKKDDAGKDKGCCGDKKGEKDREVKKEVEGAGPKREYYGDSMQPPVPMYCYGGYGHGHVFVPAEPVVLSAAAHALSPKEGRCFLLPFLLEMIVQSSG